jgi:radical SAM protein with 4Fe4S-binding SPASM domain
MLTNTTEQEQVSVKTNLSIIPKVFAHHPFLAARTTAAFLVQEKANRFDYRFLNGHTRSLSLIYMRLTPLCNLRCVMCGQRGEKGVLKGKFAIEEAKKVVPLERYLRFVDEVARKYLIFYMWGGEPFLYPGFMDLASYVVKKGCVLSVNTNGTFLEREAERIVRDGWHALFVSLDGFEETNDAIRGKGSYERVIKGFEALNQAKRRNNTDLPYLGIVSTMSNLNYRDLDKLAEAAQDFNLSWHIINLGTYTNDAVVARQRKVMQELFDTDIWCLDGFNTNYNSGIDGEEFAAILRKVHSLQPGYPIITVPAIPPEAIGTYYSDPEKPIRQRCRIPWSQTNIDYNGDVHFCADYPDYVLGNLMEADFRDIFNNERAVKFRRELKASPGGIFPGCLRCYQNMLFGSKIRGY